MNNIQIENTSDLYKSLLEQVNSDHNTFITVLLGIVVILLGATWWWNFSGANKRIKSEVNRQLALQQKEFHKIITDQVGEQVELAIKSFEQNLLMVEGSAIRSIAIQAKREKHYKHSIYWFTRHLEIYSKLEKNYDEEIRTNVNWIIENIVLLQEQDKKTNTETQLIYKKDYIIKVISQLSDILALEKKRIIKFIENRKEMEE